MNDLIKAAWRGARQGVAEGLRDARSLPKDYFAPIIFGAKWLKKMSKRAFGRA
ncbi:hypothetical protein [Dyella thiooxydans]|uniref:hypothetical protein n=1 Tax=Dyella thiooxydans TaxID=445710 RepID=UPI0012F7FE57|nr:hypothetical protein [Dyella thiooxydans]